MTMFRNLGIGAGLLGASVSVSAAIPPEVTSALTEATTDVATAGSAVLGVFVAVMVIKWLAAVIL